MVLHADWPEVPPLGFLSMVLFTLVRYQASYQWFGVPLPLISYGGTSMLTLMTGLGILMSIHTHRRFVDR